MKYRGRNIDPVRLWEAYVEFPPNMTIDGKFLPKVVCPNPDHDTLKRHFQINIQDGLVHCFAHCGISGNYEHALAVIHGYYEEFKVGDAADERSRRTRVDRARRKARRIIFRAKTDSRISPGAGVRKKRPRTRAAATTVPTLEFQTYLPPVAIEYLEERGISSASVSAFQLGWDDDEKRIVIPAKDERGRVRFLIKRAIRAKDWPKYLYWPDKDEAAGWGKTDLLFGACALDLGMVNSRGMVLTEGSLDVIRLHQHGIRNAVGIMGTGISKRQREVLSMFRPRRLYLMFDRDAAGVQNIEICARTLREYPMFVCRYPKGRSDPAELTKEEAYRVLKRAVPLAQFHRKLNVRPKGVKIVG